MGLNIENYGVLNIGGVEIWITETIVNTWIIMILLTILALFVRFKLNSFKKVPRGFQNIIEIVVEMFENFAGGMLGVNLSYISPWFFMIFVFLLTSALLSVFGLRAPTAD